MNIEDLKAQATELGISFHPNIKAATLAERIADHTKSAVEAAVEEQVESVEVEETKTQEPEPAPKAKTQQPKIETAMAVTKKPKGPMTERALAKEIEKKARELVIVTIVDNDPRTNSKTSTAVTNCSNAHFDLGTVYLPLNEKIEARRGHINTLLEVLVPTFIRDPNRPEDDVHIMVTRPRYSIVFHKQ